MVNSSKTCGKLAVPLLVLLTICFSALPAEAKYGGGTGEPNDPYLIFDANQMNAIGANLGDWDRHFKLMADIDLSGFMGTAFNIIGYRVSSSDDKPFTGVFDGSGHTISNFTYASTGRNGIGLFGYIDDPNAEIKDLGLIDPNVDAGTGDYVGSLVGGNSGTITNCYVEGGSVSGGDFVGELAGFSYGTITDCYSTGSVSGDDSVGGLAGFNGGTITNCYSEGSVSGSGEWGSVGGLVGWNWEDSTISNCYSTASVAGNDYVGGLAGANERGTITNCYSQGDVSGDYEVGGLVGSNSGTITGCYSTGSVTGTTYVGGLVGYNQSGEVTDSFWDIDTSGRLYSSGGIGKTTAEMQMQSTFTVAGWDFDNIWWISEGLDYPRLQWKETYGGGSGTAEDPYLIYTAEQLNTIGLVPFHLDRHFKLMANIDLAGFTGTSFNIIGIDYYNPFTGVFDGDDHTISNFTYTSTGIHDIGLFGCVRGENAEIKDLGLIDPNVDGGTVSWAIGSLVGRLSGGTITECYVEGGSVSGDLYVGGLVGFNHGTIANCYSSAAVSGDAYVGGLVGYNYRGTIINSYSTSSVTGTGGVGGLVGENEKGTITNSYATGSVSGNDLVVGGLVGRNTGTISNCYSTGSVSGRYSVGGLVGYNYEGAITTCYSTGSASGYDDVGGLAGENEKGTITNSYATGSVSGELWDIGGLVGWNEEGEVTGSFWDIETSGQTTSAVGTGLPTAEMQMQITFTDAGWDFTTPVWTIDEGNDYPRLWWETVPVLYAEPEVTLGTSNRISWDPVPGANDYYAECAANADFISIIYNSGWITETSYEFTGLELGKRYWYSVKARNTAGIESKWSNVESSLQGTLDDAVEIELEPESLKNKNMKNALLNKIDEALEMIDDGLYEDALDKLEHDILAKMNGCVETGEPDKNDWIITCEEQNEQYRLVIETIEYVRGLMGD